MNLPIMAIFVVATFLLGTFAGTMTTKDEMQAKAIENNCAQYNPKTSEFEWIKENSND